MVVRTSSRLKDTFVVGKTSGWGYSPFIYVRTAGFSVDHALCMAAPETCAAIDAGCDNATVAKVAASEDVRVREAARRVITRSDFKEALVWQNRGLLEMIASELQRPIDVNNSRSQSGRRLFAMYIQRYTMKNDTIGFFGPAGWARIVTDDLTVEARAGSSQLLRRRETYFEHWAMRALADHFATDPELRRAVCPRLLATARIAGTKVHYGLNSETTLPPEAISLLELCDGARSLAMIVAELKAKDDSVAEDEIVELLEELADAGIVAHRIEVPFHPDLRPERALREGLESLAPGPERARALAELDELESARLLVAQAAGDPAAVARTFDDLAARFERICKRPAHRRSGQMYAARELVYEDCVRDYDLTLGSRFVDRLDAPLSLVLAGARWSSWQVARRYRQEVRVAFEELARTTGGRPVTALQLFARLRPAFTGNPPPPIAEVTRELDTIWARILAFEPGERHVTRSSAELRASVERELVAPDGGFPHAQVHCPDLMVAASSAEAFEAGTYTIVLGEIHAATDTLAKPTNLKDHDEPEALRRSVDLAYERPLIEWVAPDAMQSHVVQLSADPNAVSIEMDPARSWRDAAHTFRIADLVAVEHDGEIRIRSLDGRLDVEAVDFASFEISAHMVGGLLAYGDGHWPRITIDQLVVSRERWSFDAAQLPADLGELRAFRAWARSHAIPRWFFLKTPEEVKPVYVDLDSPIFVENASRLMRRASRVTITEMLPTPDQTWVTDAAGARYTAELRLLLADPIRYKWR